MDLVVRLYSGGNQSRSMSSELAPRGFLEASSLETSSKQSQSFSLSSPLFASATVMAVLHLLINTLCSAGLHPFPESRCSSAGTTCHAQAYYLEQK